MITCNKPRIITWHDRSSGLKRTCTEWRNTSSGLIERKLSKGVRPGQVPEKGADDEH